MFRFGIPLSSFVGVQCVPTFIGAIVSTSRSISTTKLDDYVKLDLLEKEDAKEIKKIWVEHHRKQHCVAAILEPKLFDMLVPKTNECPLFVFPLPRKEHYETMFLQCRGNTWLITPLHDYQKEGETAKPVVSIQFFTELAKSKDLVLMRGDIHTDQLQAQHVQTLINQLQIFYLNEEHYQNHVKIFNHKPNEFDYNKVIATIESLGGAAAPVAPKE